MTLHPPRLLALVLACIQVSVQPMRAAPYAGLGYGPLPASTVLAVPAVHRATVLPPQPISSKADQPPPVTALAVPLNGSYVLDQPAGIRRLSIATSEIAEAIAVSSTEVVINGKLPGDTTLIIWDQKGGRTLLAVHVLANPVKLDAVRAELLREAGPDSSIDVQDGLVFLNGTVKDATAAGRAVNIVSALGKVVNLLRVLTPPAEPQILLKVRFADVDRSTATQFGLNLFSIDSKGLANSTTGQFGSSPTLSPTPGQPVTLDSLLNIFYYRPDINLGAILEDLATKSLLQILAEPNLLTISGKPASFLAGGEFPFPTLQGGGAGVGQVTIQFKEFGIRLNFLPTVTPRGTIHLSVNPEVSSLDYANGLSVSGITIPALSSRKVQTEIELENGQSFVIAGLLNNQVTEQLSRMPGLSSIPLLGKLFDSRSTSKSNSELLIMVTPEIVQPLPAGAKLPDVAMPVPFLKDTPGTPPRHPGTAALVPLPAMYRRESVPFEELKGISSQPSTTDSPGLNNNGISPPQPLALPPLGNSVPAAGQTSRP
jgi:pilus assembly protein CpaC